jgi:hypothetical protein
MSCHVVYVMQCWVGVVKTIKRQSGAMAVVTLRLYRTYATEEQALRPDPAACLSEAAEGGSGNAAVNGCSEGKPSRWQARRPCRHPYILPGLLRILASSHCSAFPFPFPPPPLVLLGRPRPSHPQVPHEGGGGGLRLRE